MPDPFIVGGIIFEPLHFLGIAAGAGYVLKNTEIGPAVQPEDDAKELSGIECHAPHS